MKPKEQTKSTKEIFPEVYDSVEIKNELNEIKGYEKKPFDFRIFKTIRSFGDYIYNSKITINEADREQSDLIEYIMSFNNKKRLKIKDDKKTK